MIKGNVTTDLSARVESLRAAANQAEQLAALATLADAQLTRASNDLATLAQAARRLATSLNCDADTAEVNGAIGGGK
jgi:hypothetical protein